ncbi:DUF485 domain-containing protein [Streptomyces sp. 8N706]|uniref:DUF485 domain-containing protein n=1 Tax=Streptomyces sp. 8N706 TaxID=3457416 RepID=UPI003FD3EAB2
MRGQRGCGTRRLRVEKHDGREAGSIRLDDPWYDVIASGWGESADGSAEPEGQVAAATPPPMTEPEEYGDEAAQRAAAGPDAADVYLEVQRSAAFQEVRSRYRRFVLPACIAFLTWYFAYVVAAIAAPGLMARPVAGSLNVAMLAGLAQFATTFLLTYAYARHARLRRDRLALDLRWIVFEQNRQQESTRGRES